jgi:hypothetical protein
METLPLESSLAVLKAICPGFLSAETVSGLIKSPMN